MGDPWKEKKRKLKEILIDDLFKSLILQIAHIRLQLVKYQTYRVAIFAQIHQQNNLLCG